MLWFVRNTYIFAYSSWLTGPKTLGISWMTRGVRTSFVLVFTLLSSVPWITGEPLRWNGCLIHNKPLFTTPGAAVQPLSRVQLFASTWTAACQASLSCIISQSLLKLKSTELVMSSSHLILCCPLLLSPSVLLSIRVFSNESALPISWPKYWSFSIIPSNEYSGLIKVKWVHYS